MEILKDFGLFLYGILKGAISTFSTLLIMYLVVFLIAKVACCSNSKSDYKQFKKNFNSACMNFMKALYEISVASLDSAKLWAENKILRNKEKRRNRVYRQ